eukprot:54423-Prorocentrum_lima.AAC.1
MLPSYADWHSKVSPRHTWLRLFKGGPPAEWGRGIEVCLDGELGVLLGSCVWVWYVQGFLTAAVANDFIVNH